MARIEFSFRVAPDHPSLPGHFPGRPIVPGVLLLDLVMQSLQRTTGQRLAHLQRVKFVSALSPGEQANGAFEINGDRASFRATACRDGIAVLIVEGAGSISPREQRAAA